MWAAGKDRAEIPEEPGSRLCPANGVLGRGRGRQCCTLHPCRQLCVPKERAGCLLLGHKCEQKFQNWPDLQFSHGCMGPTPSLVMPLGQEGVPVSVWSRGCVAIPGSAGHHAQPATTSAAARARWQQVTSYIGTEVLLCRTQLRGWIQCSHYAAGIFLASVWLTFYYWLPPVSL